MGLLQLKGRPASAGFAAGRVQRLRQSSPAARRQGSPADEALVLRREMARAVVALEALAADLEGEAAEMVAFQIAMLKDPALSEPAFEAIGRAEAAERAWSAALDAEIAGYAESDDEHFRARAADLIDIRDRVAALLGGVAMPRIEPGSVVLAADITVSQFLGADWRGGGIALLHGSATSHVGMLARARGVPMVVNLDTGAADVVGDGAAALLDGEGGTLTIHPDDQAHEAFSERRRLSWLRGEATRAHLYKPAHMADGTRVTVLLNLADPSELDGLDPSICDGIGLVRTELLFEGAAPPSEERQLSVYRKIVQWAAGRPVTIRTLDAGGDKAVAGITLNDERNPFLGVRGIRLSLRHPDLFKVQLRALLRVASEGPIEILIPMVSTPSEVEETRRLIDACRQELAVRGVPHQRPPLGIMVEVPAVAVAPERFDADFYSIGSNDLVQYTLAAGRDVAALADLADPTDPSVLRLIGQVVAHGFRAGRKVSLCGDAGGDPRVIPHLLDAGLRVLSMSPAEVATGKLAIAAHTPAPAAPMPNS